MARLPRKTCKLFASDYVATPDSQIAQFGSDAAGSPLFSSDPDVIQALSRFLQGWSGAVVGTDQPAKQDRTAIDYLFSQFLCYIFQLGLAEWDASTVYYTGSLVNDGTGIIYRSKVDNNTDVLSNTNSWQTYQSFVTGQNLIRAFVVFDGTTSPPTIKNSFNVSSVTKGSAGYYVVNFSINMPVDGSGNGTYGFDGSAGTPNGSTSIAGDNNTIAGSGAIGIAAVRTATQCGIVCWEPNVGGVGAAEDSQLITVNFYG